MKLYKSFYENNQTNASDKIIPLYPLRLHLNLNQQILQNKLHINLPIVSKKTPQH